MTELERILDEDFVYVNSHGKKSSRAAYIELCTSGNLRFYRQDVEGLEVQDFGRFALATMILSDEFDYSGQRYNGKFLSFSVFRRTDDGWKWSGGQTREA